MEYGLKWFWRKYFDLNWKFGFFLLLLVCVPRFILVLNANETGNYSFIGLVMFISALIPFVFLNRHGREQIGILKPTRTKSLVYALIFGLIFSYALYWIGQNLYGDSYENWYAYIGKSYNIPNNITEHDKKVLFAIMAIVGMTFSPIGEELFFRGIVHTSFANSYGDKNATIIDSLAFAFTHISHFGFVYINSKWTFYVLPSLIWVLSMFLVGVLFFLMKRTTGSILGSVVCHSGFNLGMMYCIFYLV